MIKFIYAVYDKKAQVFGNPFYSITAATALRDFGHAAKDPANEIGRYPEDFSLWFFGQWDDSKGHMELQEAQHVSNAIDFNNSEAQS